MKTSARPPLVISRVDCERLEALLEKRLPPGLDLDSLRDELARAEVVEPGDMPGDVITMNSTARFVDEHDGAEHEITLVWPHEMDGRRDKVSILAPVGSALLGLHVGDRIEWPAPGGRTLTLRVLSIQ